MEDHLGRLTLDRDVAEEREDTCVSLGKHSDGRTPRAEF